MNSAGVMQADRSISRSLTCNMQAVIDSVKSYIGLKKISLGRVDPSSPDSPIRIFLNNKSFTQFAFLDQVIHVHEVASNILPQDQNM